MSSSAARTVSYTPSTRSTAESTNTLRTGSCTAATHNRPPLARRSFTVATSRPSPLESMNVGEVQNHLPGSSVHDVLKEVLQLIPGVPVKLASHADHGAAPTRRAANCKFTTASAGTHAHTKHGPAS